jgi:hypothetical protein
MAAHKTRLKGGGHGGVTGMLTAHIALSFGCPASPPAAGTMRRAAFRRSRSTTDRDRADGTEFLKQCDRNLTERDTQ